jgi:mannose-6-phosphate isomerase-like protein (cupin superfamily)
MSTSLPRLLAFTLVPLGLALAGPTHAQTAPRAFDASPDVYNVISQNEQFKLILVTYKRGEKDKPHSHPVNAVYFLDDCVLRFHAPDGSTRDLTLKSGSGTVQPATVSHVVENVGPRDCRTVLFEPN